MQNYISKMCELLHVLSSRPVHDILCLPFVRALFRDVQWWSALELELWSLKYQLVCGLSPHAHSRLHLRRTRRRILRLHPRRPNNSYSSNLGSNNSSDRNSNSAKVKVPPAIAAFKVLQPAKDLLEQTWGAAIAVVQANLSHSTCEVGA